MPIVLRCCPEAAPRLPTSKILFPDEEIGVSGVSLSLSIEAYFPKQNMRIQRGGGYVVRDASADVISITSREDVCNGLCPITSACVS